MAKDIYPFSLAEHKILLSAMWSWEQSVKRSVNVEKDASVRELREKQLAQIRNLSARLMSSEFSFV